MKVLNILKITKIKNVDREPVYDIGVPDLHNYVLKNGHVVHNCDTGQQLTAEGFNYKVLSVDRVDNNICIPYQYLRSTIYEKRIDMYRSERLFDEAISVERNNNNGKVDHPPNGHKDVLDAVAGATYNASRNAEQYAWRTHSESKH